MAEVMDEKKALSWQALYDNTWGIFALGILIPTTIYTVWGLIEIMFMVPPLDVNKAMESLKPAQQAVAPAAPQEQPAAHEAAP